jgi:hypothetical protein
MDFNGLKILRFYLVLKFGFRKKNCLFLKSRAVVSEYLKVPEKQILLFIRKTAYGIYSFL